MADAFLRKLGIKKDKLLTTSRAKNKARKHAWERWELEILEASFKDLAYRSHTGAAIDKDTFLKFFVSVPGMLGERLFHVFDVEGHNCIDKQQYIDGLYKFSRGGSELKMRFIFDMFDLEGKKAVSRAGMKTMLNSVLFAAQTINSSVEITDSKLNQLIADSVAVCSEQEQKEDAMSLYSFSKWLQKHPLIVDVLDIIFAGGQDNNKNNNKNNNDPNSTTNGETHSLSSVLAPRNLLSDQVLESTSMSSASNQGPHHHHQHPAKTPKSKRIGRRGGSQTFNFQQANSLSKAVSLALTEAAAATETDRDRSEVLAAAGMKIECGACSFVLSIEHCYHCGKRLPATTTTITGETELEQVDNNNSNNTATATAATTGSSSNCVCTVCGPIFLTDCITFCMCCGQDLREQLNGKVEPQLNKSLKHKGSDQVRITGHLLKVGSRLGKITQRFYCIRDNFLYAYHKHGDMLKQKKPTSILFLEGLYVESLNHEEKNSKLKYGIEVIITEDPRRTRVLYATSSEQRRDWLAAINKAANIHDIGDYYTIGRELGVGKFSTVREGISKVNGRSYAIKIMDKTSLDEKEKEALRTEIAVLKLIQHPGVIKLKNVFETRRQIHIVMSYISGGDLFDVLAIQKTYSERAARSLVKHLLEILEYLHLRGIVHRDLKPENILMKTDEAKRVYHDDIILADFGLSKFNIPTQVMDLACGTLAYVAPEVLQEEGYGKEVDLWAVGVILYLVIRGQLPFDSNDQQEIITKTIEAKIDFDHAVFALNDTGVSTECRDVISQLLQKDPAQRVNATEALQHPWFALDLGPCRTDENLREDRSDNDTTTTTTTTTTAPVSPLKSPLAKLVVPTPTTTTVAPVVVVASGVVPYLAEFEQDSATEDIMNELDSLEVDVETQSTLDELFDLGLESSPVSPILSPDAFAERRRSITQEEDSELIDDL